MSSAVHDLAGGDLERGEQRGRAGAFATVTCDNPSSVASSRDDQCVTPSRSGGGSNVASTTSTSSICLRRPRFARHPARRVLQPDSDRFQGVGAAWRAVDSGGGCGGRPDGLRGSRGRRGAGGRCRRVPSSSSASDPAVDDRESLLVVRRHWGQIGLVQPVVIRRRKVQRAGVLGDEGAAAACPGPASPAHPPMRSPTPPLAADQSCPSS